MTRTERRYRVEVQGAQLTATSGEGGVRLDGDERPIPITDDARLRSFTGTLSDGSRIPIYVEEGENEHEYTVYLAGQAVPVRVVTPRDERLLALRKNTAQGTSAAQLLSAPMPGLLKEILVGEGEIVEKGRALCILEAMKMENEIKSPGRFRVKRVIAQAGSAVEKGTRLLELVPPGDEE